MPDRSKILIIKHGALGDLITATGAFAHIRRCFSSAHLTLLTESKFKDLGQKMGYFDEVIVDQRGKNPFKILSFCQRLKKEGFSFIFDLQNSKRTSLYHCLMGPFNRPKWSGIAPGCSHPQTRSDRHVLHAAPRFADQLKEAGIEPQGNLALYPDLDWMSAPLAHVSPSLKPPFALLIPGSSLSGIYKRWPADCYVTLARWLSTEGIQPVLISGKEDKVPADILKSQVPDLCDFSCQLSLFEIAELARQAIFVVGNDTGPTLISAGVGAVTYILWSGASDPEVYAPRGSNVHILFEKKLENLSASRVQAVLKKSFQAKKNLKKQIQLDEQGLDTSFLYKQ